MRNIVFELHSHDLLSQSVFTFIQTDVESPADIDQSCLTIDEGTLGTKYLGKKICMIIPFLWYDLAFYAYIKLRSKGVTFELYA